MKLFDTQKDADAIYELEHKTNTTIRQTPHALLYHLMPPTGWMNDPNGLCQVHDFYHIFFQYAPYAANGDGLKYWGHYETKDFIHYTYTGVFLSPDEPIDKDGVYSGCCMVEDDTMYIYYTGNVLMEGDYDYTTKGRGSNTTLVTSKDGILSSDKQCLLSSEDYPSSLSCHVRDPKVFKQGDLYYMVLGARTKEDSGCVMIYTSSDKQHFTFSQFIQTKETFGYMWECPDIFSLKEKAFLSVSPQGLSSFTDHFQNVYQSGYFPLTPKSISLDSKTSHIQYQDVPKEEFVEWDMGFDFYAPQTFEDALGRRILIGWIGNPDAPYQNPTIADGWQHALTLPRQLTLSADEKYILQNPIAEIEKLRAKKLSIHENQTTFFVPGSCELLLSDFMASTADEVFCLFINQSIHLSYHARQKLFQLSFIANAEEKKNAAKGYGRTIRNVILHDTLSNLRLFLDTSCLEIYINNGEKVLTTRFYTETTSTHELHFSSPCKIDAYELSSFTYEGLS